MEVRLSQLFRVFVFIFLFSTAIFLFSNGQTPSGECKGSFEYNLETTEYDPSKMEINIYSHEFNLLDWDFQLFDLEKGQILKIEPVITSVDGRQSMNFTTAKSSSYVVVAKYKDCSRQIGGMGIFFTEVDKRSRK